MEVFAPGGLTETVLTPNSNKPRSGGVFWKDEMSPQTKSSLLIGLLLWPPAIAAVGCAIAFLKTRNRNAHLVFGAVAILTPALWILLTRWLGQQGMGMSTPIEKGIPLYLQLNIPVTLAYSIVCWLSAK